MICAAFRVLIRTRHAFQLGITYEFLNLGSFSPPLNVFQVSQPPALIKPIPRVFKSPNLSCLSYILLSRSLSLSRKQTANRVSKMKPQKPRRPTFLEPTYQLSPELLLITESRRASLVHPLFLDPVYENTGPGEWTLMEI